MQNHDMPEYFGPNTYLAVHSVYVPEIGSYLMYDQTSYEITEVTTTQEMVLVDDKKSIKIGHVMTCYEVDEEASIIPGMSPTVLTSDMMGITAI